MVANVAQCVTTTDSHFSTMLEVSTIHFLVSRTDFKEQRNGSKQALGHYHVKSKMTVLNHLCVLLMHFCMIPVAVVAFSPVPVPVSLQLLGVVHSKHSSIYQDSKTELSAANEVDALVASSQQSPAFVKSSDASIKWDTMTIFTNVMVMASVFGGSVLTFALNNYLSIGPIKASSTVGLIGAVLLPEKLALAALCGSFAGMARLSVIPGIRASIVLGALCAATMAFFDRKKWLVGLGGRLGFIAQIACTSQFLLSSLIFPSSTGGARLIGTFPSMGKLAVQLVPTCICTLMGALFMSACKEGLAHLSLKVSSNDRVATILRRLSTSVAAVSVTGLMASLFPVSCAGPAFCGSFIAMSSPVKIKTYGGLMGAALVGGFCQLALTGVLLGGWGGKLGTSSLLGVIVFRAIQRIFQSTAGNQKEPR